MGNGISVIKSKKKKKNSLILSNLAIAKQSNATTDRVVACCCFNQAMLQCIASLWVENRFLYSLLVCVINSSATKTHFVLYISDSHKERTNIIKRVFMYRVMHEWNLLPRHVTQENN